MQTSGVHKASVGDLEMAYETFGDPSDTPLLLVMGLATQMIGWPDDFCRGLAGRGLFVIRFDNRDIGLSTHLHDAGAPDVMAVPRSSPRTTAPPTSAPSPCPRWSCTASTTPW